MTLSLQSSSHQASSVTQEVPAFRYNTYVYSDGKSWENSSGRRLLVEETWIPSKMIAYNKIEGVFRLNQSRPAQRDACSAYQSALKPISLTEDQVNAFHFGAKKKLSEYSESKR